MEKVAIAQYSKHVGDTIEKCGIFIDPTYNFLAASPDGINKDRNLIIEIKCPFGVRFEKPSTVSYLVNGSLSRKHPYCTQADPSVSAFCHKNKGM